MHGFLSDSLLAIVSISVGFGLDFFIVHTLICDKCACCNGENEKKSDNLTEQLNECTDEISDYESYINRIYLFTDEFDMIYDDDINFEKFSRDEFIAYVFLRTDCGREAFPSYIRDDISEVVHEVLGYLRRNGWNSFLEWVAKNN